MTDNHPFLSFTHDPTRPRSSVGTNSHTYGPINLAQAIVPATSLDYGEPHKLDRPDNITDFVGATSTPQLVCGPT